MGTEKDRRSATLWVGLVALLCCGVLAWGGYAAHWAWTGLSGDVKLWDWLEALALPVTIGLVPLFLAHRHRLEPRHKHLAAAALAGVTALVLAGYLVPLRWTGFVGNTLWDWLSLALLPLVIATATLWQLPRRWRRRHVSLVAAGAAVAVVLVLAGYLVPWEWTGFVGNTAWDWLKLLLLPVLVPTLVLPVLVESTESWMTRGQPGEQVSSSVDAAERVRSRPRSR